jgi:hypothetical protein
MSKITFSEVNRLRNGIADIQKSKKRAYIDCEKERIINIGTNILDCKTEINKEVTLKRDFQVNW